MSTATYAAPGPDVTGDEGIQSFNPVGDDWSSIAEEIAREGEERVVINMGPQHPSTHGVLRMVVELEGEIVTDLRAGIGYLHTGIEKNMEFRRWDQGSVFMTRMDYVANLNNEAAYCLAVEKLLGITDQIPERATVIRVLMMELNRAASHLVAIGTTGNELGGTTLLEIAFREREHILRFLEACSGLRMNNEYIRIGGVDQDIPPDALAGLKEAYPKIMAGVKDLEDLLLGNPIFIARNKGIGYLSLAGCMALGVTGPILRSTGLPYDIRKAQPYCGYETYDFDVVTHTDCDAWGRTCVRFGEIREAMKIVAQCIERLEAMGPGPVMVEDKKIGWPAKMSIGPDGQGQSPEHVAGILGTSDSMESLIHHFKLVTEGFRVPAGQTTQLIEHPKGVMGVHVVSDGGTRPYRVHVREPSFNNLQASAAMTVGGMLSDIPVAMASIDPVFGGVDR